jgi:hypothetical protein
MVTDNTLEITLDTWIISDTHFFHENIGKYCSRPENWQELIIKNWNDLVSPEETVLHLGDFALGKKSNFDLLTSMSGLATAFPAMPFMQTFGSRFVIPIIRGRFAAITAVLCQSIFQYPDPAFYFFVNSY